MNDFEKMKIWGRKQWYRIKFLPTRLGYRWRGFCRKLSLAWNIGLLNSLSIWREYRKSYEMLVALHGPDRVKKGRLEAFFETGTEGMCWTLYEDRKSGYDGLHSLEKGDRLIIGLHDGTIAFDGLLDPDWEIGKQPYPMNPEYGQPCAHGCWIHWTQSGWTPEDWAALFLHGVIISEEHSLLSAKTDKVPYRAIVVLSDRHFPSAQEGGNGDEDE